MKAAPGHRGHSGQLSPGGDFMNQGDLTLHRDAVGTSGPLGQAD